ncbi:DUF4307 domain-containing protein [Microbacterium sp. STN6]|uniref:DUF4307 domain-containing protein n=1 Tax=Microbacterium sp. STN6 TaxID=2995588 RepID=UPI002260E157|nr:DUF4307 domain-containing protein [Microbacterium sp. STN6]MCX7521861.1 DUF4307 domain-containing protein [Microbacterium sp. STN6]
MTDELSARYGRTRGKARRDRWWMVGVAIAFVAVFAAWVIWVGLGSPASTIETQDIGHTIDGEHAVTVRFTVNVDAGTAVNCAVEAMNEQFAVVGWKIVSYPAASGHLTNHTEVVRTTQQATTGLINRCWLA